MFITFKLTDKTMEGIIFELMEEIKEGTEAIREQPGARRAVNVAIARMWINCLIASMPWKEPVVETEDEDETHLKGHKTHGAATVRPQRIIQMCIARTAFLRVQRQHITDPRDAISRNLRRI